MRIQVKLIVVGISIAYGGFVTKLAYDQQERIDILEKKLKKSKKKAKKYKKELLKPLYRRSILPRNGKTVPKQKPKYPIGFA